MRIIQVTPTLSIGDGVGNHIHALYRVIQEMGFDTAVYAQNFARSIPKTARNDVIVIGENRPGLQLPVVLIGQFH